MKTKPITPSRSVLVGACLLFLFPAMASAGGFARAGALYVGYAESDFSGEAGGSVAAGFNWGATSEHELGVEIAHASWSFNRPLGLNAPGLGINGSGGITPILAHYRYYLGPSESRFRFYAGAYAGITRVSGDVAASLSGVQYTSATDSTEATYGGTIGVSATLGPSLSLDLGYRYWNIRESEHASRLTGGSAGPAFKLSSLSAHVVALSVKLAF